MPASKYLAGQKNFNKRVRECVCVCGEQTARCRKEPVLVLFVYQNKKEETGGQKREGEGAKTDMEVRERNIA